MTDLAELNKPSRYENIRKAGAVFVCLACFFTPLSTSLLGVFSLLALSAWVLSGSFLQLPTTLRQHPAALSALVLFLFMGIAIFYSPVPLPTALDTLKKYRELFLLPVAIALISEEKLYRTLAENAFLAGCVILMLLSYLIFWGVLPEERYGHSIVFHITHSFFMAVLAYWSLHRIAGSWQYRYLWLVIFLLTVINIFYIAPGRTGMFVFICLMVLYCFQHLSVLKCFLGLLLLVLLCLLAYRTSDNFSGRIQEVVTEIKHYKPGISRTSIGQRFDWWKADIYLIKQKPLLGYGTGSYQFIQKKAPSAAQITATDNPHNEYLFITIQFGFAGLTLFLLLLLLQFFGYRQLAPENRRLLQGVVWAIVAGSVMNSLIFDSQSGHFYLLMSAVLMADKPQDDHLVL